MIANAIPPIVAVVTAFWAALLARVSNKLKAGPDPFWPFAQNPGLALELCASESEANAILGKSGTALGEKNRRAAASVQKLDFVFILLYVAFFITTALLLAPWPACWPAVAAAVVTGIFDYWEDFRILGALRENANFRPPKPIGQLKWLFYFVTLAIEATLLFEYGIGKGGKGAIGMAFAVLPAATAIGGLYSSIKGSFNGILSASRLSVLGLLLLALAPLIMRAHFSWHIVATYAVLMRVPLLTAGGLALLPIISFTAARSLLRGLFDLTPLSIFAVALTTLATAGSAAMAAHIVLAESHVRFGVDTLGRSPDFDWWLVRMIAFTTPILGASVWFSGKQGRGIWKCLLAAIGGVAVGVGLTYAVGFFSNSAHIDPAWLPAGFGNAPVAGGLFVGYVETDHFLAFLGFVFTLLVYVALGVYGYSKLGRAHTVPALCSALMLLTMVTWMLAGVAFFFDLWRVPILLIVAVAGTLTAQSVRSDHFYKLRDRSTNPMPDAWKTMAAARCDRIIVAAANGGGIQAGAWAAQVLFGLQQDCGEAFRRSLRLISSVSGGSVGSAFYVHWLANPGGARRPDEAAAMSSLDEVAWGLGWPDFLRALFPWVFGFLIGRGRAIEKAWCLNGARDLGDCSLLDEPLSSWNQPAAEGEIPAVVMNATIAETGERLLLATTSFGGQTPAGKARVDASELHRINGKDLDVSIVTAARLSASFPYVTPASRSDGPGPQPHIVDGGYYDNYGMATLVEWLDEALTGADGAIKEVLVLQIHGAPVDEDAKRHRHEKTRGWFYQAIAPLITLANVRSSGQIAHNNIELELLRQKWRDMGVHIKSEVFEFKNRNAPLSWHLTPEQVAEVAKEWDCNMDPCRRAVRDFLSRAACA